MNKTTSEAVRRSYVPGPCSDGRRSWSGSTLSIIVWTVGVRPTYHVWRLRAGRDDPNSPTLEGVEAPHKKSLVGEIAVLANLEILMSQSSAVGDLLLIVKAMKPAEHPELMDEDDNLSRNSRYSWRDPLSLTLGV
jgi:hypothetical protein